MFGRQKSPELLWVGDQLRHYFGVAAAFSLAINVLYLAAPLYMLQVYDRVVSSGSTATLVMLTVVLLLAFATLAGLDSVRARVLTRASVRLDELLGRRIVAATLDRGGTSRSQPLRDFDTYRQFVTGSGINALFDLPWAPVYLAVIFLLHPVLGWFALGSAMLLGAMAGINEWLVRAPLKRSNDAATANYGFTEMSLRNAEVVQAMGMVGGLLNRWGRDRNRVLAQQVIASDRAATMASVIRFLRLSMQSLVLGIGAYLVIERLSTVGVMFASSLLLGRALQPVEQVVGSWRGLVAARAAYGRVTELLAQAPLPRKSVALPRPTGRLNVDGITYVPPGSAKPVLRAVSFALEAGESLGVIGASGAGKSTLARLIVGVLKPSAGAVRLDAADVSAWPRADLGRHVGYLPQDIELFADTVAANISRFRENVDAHVVRAAEIAGVHAMILRLPAGYETQIGDGGAVLSGGYRQRIALARAVFGAPRLVVLDEPSSNLDGEGDAALAECVRRLKETGATVIIISHRPTTLNAVDKILILRDGTVDSFGERQLMMGRLTRPVEAQAGAPAQTPPLRPVRPNLQDGERAAVGAGA